MCQLTAYVFWVAVAVHPSNCVHSVLQVSSFTENFGRLAFQVEQEESSCAENVVGKYRSDRKI